jgi:hypothetical protein
VSFKDLILLLVRKKTVGPVASFTIFLPTAIKKVPVGRGGFTEKKDSVSHCAFGGLLLPRYSGSMLRFGKMLHFPHL